MFAMFCYQGLLLLHFSYNQLSLSRRFDVLRILSTNCILNFLQLIFFILLNQIISYQTCLVRLLELTLKDSSVIFINICINPQPEFLIVKRSNKHTQKPTRQHLSPFFPPLSQPKKLFNFELQLSITQAGANEPKPEHPPGAVTVLQQVDGIYRGPKLSIKCKLCLVCSS